MPCPKCGAELEDGNSCTVCGTKYDQSPAQELPSDDNEPHAGKFTVPGFTVPPASTLNPTEDRDEIIAEPQAEEPELEPDVKSETVPEPEPELEAEPESMPEPAASIPMPEPIRAAFESRRETSSPPPLQRAPVPEQGFESSRAFPRDGAESKKSGVVPIVIIIVLLVALIGISVVLFVNFSEPDEASPEILTYEALIEDYFAVFQSGDTDRFIELLPEKLVFEMRKEGISQKEVPEMLDYWYEDWGDPLLRWEFYSVFYEDVRDAYILDFGYSESEIERYLNVTAEVVFEDEKHEEYYFDFDVVLIDGQWYIIEVW